MQLRDWLYLALSISLGWLAAGLADDLYGRQVAIATALLMQFPTALILGRRL